MLHPEAKKAMKRRLEAALDSSTIDEGYISFFSTEQGVEEFLKETLKHFKDVNYLDIIFAVQKFTNLMIDSKFESYDERKEFNGELKELLSGDEFSDLVEEITTYFSSLPHDYEIYFPLASVETIHHNILKITDEVFLYEVKEGDGKLGEPIDDTPKLSFLKRRNQGDIYLCVNIKGSCVFTFENKAVSKSYSLFKQFIHSGITKGILKRNYSSTATRRMPLLGLEFEKDKLLVKDLNNEKLDYLTLNLAPNVLEYISQLEINSDYLEFYRTETRATNEQLMSFIAGAIGSEILNPNNSENENLLTAIDWSFESKVNPNNTFSFIQLCIALEAILSDNSESESITKTLSDRAAYFIGESVNERRKIIDQFKELYGLRSKLVHGRKANLQDDEESLYNWGTDLLEKIIKKEFSLLK